jgi:hypothetical protein
MQKRELAEGASRPTVASPISHARTTQQTYSRHVTVLVQEWQTSAEANGNSAKGVGSRTW